MFSGTSRSRDRRRLRNRGSAVPALAAAGADVLCTDIDGEAAERTGSTLGSGARSARLDVTDAAAVQTAVDDVWNGAAGWISCSTTRASSGAATPNC